MTESNTWFDDCKDRLSMRVIDVKLVPVEDEISKQVKPVADEELDALTFEELWDFTAKDVPDMDLDEETSVYRLCAILASRYLNAKVEERLGPDATRYRIRLD